MKIGIDLGGSHIAIGLVDEEQIVYKFEKSFTKEDKNNTEESIKKYIFEGIQNISNIEKLDNIEMIGVSAPGRIKEGTISDSPNLDINGLNIKALIEKEIDIPVYVKNDGMCAGLAEKEYGSLKESMNGVFLGIGTGIGTAVFIGGKLMEEIRSAGHMIVEKNGKKCNCGKNGCYEAYASMRVLKENIRRYFNDETLSSEEILKLLQDKQNLNNLEDIINDYIAYLAIGISNMARLCSADTVVIGGSFVHYKDILFEKLQNELDRIMIPLEKKQTTIKLAEFSNDAGIIGATLIK